MNSVFIELNYKTPPLGEGLVYFIEEMCPSLSPCCKDCSSIDVLLSRLHQSESLNVLYDGYNELIGRLEEFQHIASLRYDQYHPEQKEQANSLIRCCYRVADYLGNIIIESTIHHAHVSINLDNICQPTTVSKFTG